MPLNVHELADLKARSLFASTYGFTIAHAKEYALEMIAEVGDVSTSVEPYSPEHIHQLTCLVEKSRSEVKDKPKKAPPAKPAPAPSKPKVEPKTVAEAAKAVAEPKVEPKPKTVEVPVKAESVEVPVEEPVKTVEVPVKAESAEVEAPKAAAESDFTKS